MPKLNKKFNQVIRHNNSDYGFLSLTVNGMRDVPIKVRSRFEKMIRETIDKLDTPVSFEYSFGTFEYEGKIYLHKLTVCFLYWDGYSLMDDYVNFLL